MTLTPEEEVGLAIGANNPDQRRIAQAGLELTSLVLRKNHDYGASAWESPMLCPELSPGDAILCRLSDKIKRLTNLQSSNAAQVAESIEDTISDMAGYCLLWLARPKNGGE